MKWIKRTEKFFSTKKKLNKVEIISRAYAHLPVPLIPDGRIRASYFPWPNIWSNTFFSFSRKFIFALFALKWKKVSIEHIVWIMEKKMVTIRKNETNEWNEIENIIYKRVSYTKIIQRNFTYSDALHKHARRKSHRQCSVLVFDLDIFYSLSLTYQRSLFTPLDKMFRFCFEYRVGLIFRCSLWTNERY